MRNNYLINFKLFCSRKGFDLENWIINTEDYSYELLCKMLVALKVCPPSKEYFSLIESKLNSDALVKKADEIKLAKSPARQSRKKKKNEKDKV